jgi:alcohol dehydrogenase class IV
MDRRSVSAPEHAQNRPETVWTLQLPQLRFGRDAITELPHQLLEIGVAEPASGVLITDETIAEFGHADRICEILEEAGFDVDVYSEAHREPSIDSIEHCLTFVEQATDSQGYDFYLGVGGGTCMDTAKTVRTVRANDGDIIDYISEPTGNGQHLERSGAPLVLVPTTAGTGSEISPVAIVDVPDAGTKEGISSPYVRADAAVLDPTLSVTLSPKETAMTAMDALGQAIEGYTTHSYDSLLRATDPKSRPVYAGRTPVTEMCSERAIRLLSNNVRSAVHNGDNLEARENMLLGALFGGIAALTAGSNLCHAMSYPVANEWHTYHGETIAVLTPASTLDYNVGSDPERYARIAELLGVNTDRLDAHDAADAAKAKYIRLQKDLNVVPSGLNELTGATEDDVEDLAQQCLTQQKRLVRCNPRLPDREEIADVYRDALYNWDS